MSENRAQAAIVTAPVGLFHKIYRLHEMMCPLQMFGNFSTPRPGSEVAAGAIALARGWSIAVKRAQTCAGVVHATAPPYAMVAGCACLTSDRRPPQSRGARRKRPSLIAGDMSTACGRP
jgi:hypothetical protein